MRYLELIVFLLVAKDVISSRCPFETETQYCECGNLFSNDNLDIKCSRPLLPTNTQDQFFLIKLSGNEININCSASLDWSNFDYKFSNEVGELNALNINNCIFQKNMNFIRIAELIHAKNIRELRLTNTFQNGAIDFDDHLLKGLKHLDKLYIMNNENLTQIDKDLLLFLPFLTEFYLVNSNLESIPDDLLVFLPEITVLQLSNNRIGSLSSQTFKNLGTLKNLDLSQNELKDLPSELFDSLINLESLVLFGNDIPHIPEYAFSKLENLKYLHLGSIGLGLLVEHTFQNNRKLELLNLQDNYLKVLPNRIFDGLINLRELKMDNNELESLDEDIFSNTKNLVTLTLSDNNLKSFGDLTFRNLPKLEKLDIRHNGLKNLADTAFSKGEMGDFINTSPLFRDSLIEYETNDEKKKDQPLVSIFFNCSSLTHLYLSHNNIQKIHEDWFLMSKLNLQTLDLSHNSISEININRPLRQQHDFYVDLSYNQITSILPTNFSKIRIETGNALVMNMSQNPFKCDCDVTDFVQYLNLKLKSLDMSVLNIIGQDLKCDQPEEYKGLLLTTLKENDLSCEVPLYEQNKSCRRECNVRTKYEEYHGPNTRGVVNNILQIYQFNCSNKNLPSIPEGLCIIPESNVELDLSNNKLSRIPVFDDPKDYDAVTKLDLSKNEISSLDGISSFKNLQILNIENNGGSFLVITEDTLAELGKMTKLQRISFRNSLFMCDDNFFSLMQYEVSGLIAYRRELGCVTDTFDLIRPFLIRTHRYRFSDDNFY